MNTQNPLSTTNSMISKQSSEIDCAASLGRVFLPNAAAPFAIFFLGSLFFGFPYILLRDGATCRHINTGLYIFQHHIIPHVNYTWAIDPTCPWFTHELASDLAFGGAYKMLGLNGIVLLTGLPLAFVLIWTMQMGRVRGLGPLSAWIAFIPVLLSTTVHWSARPHIFSYVFFLLLYWFTFLGNLSLVRRTVLAALICGIWVNFHGSALTGIGILLLSPLSLFADWYKNRHQKFSNVLKELAPAAAALTALCFTARGPALYGYIFSYLTNFQRFTGPVDRGADWSHFDINIVPGSWAFLVTLLGTIFIFWLARYRPPLEEGLLLVFLALASFYAMRLIPYFALVAMPSIAPAWRKLLLSINSPDFIPEKSSTLTRFCKNQLKRFLLVDLNLEKHEFQKGTPQSSILFSLALLAMVLIFLIPPPFSVKDFNSASLPTNTVTFIAKHFPDKLGLVTENWGPYLYFKLHRPVFVDDKGDFYPPAFLSEYQQCVDARPGWQNTLNKYNLDYAILPKYVPLSKVMGKGLEWKSVFEDQASYLFVRKKLLEPKSD